jgi:hypothetical protein
MKFRTLILAALTALPVSGRAQQSAAQEYAAGVIAAAQAAQADQKDAQATRYDEAFYVYYSSASGGCFMSVSEGHLAYGLSGQGLRCRVFNPGQTLKGRFLNKFGVGQAVELQYTTDKGKQKTEQYRITFRKSF